MEAMQKRIFKKCRMLSKKTERKSHGNIILKIFISECAQGWLQIIISSDKYTCMIKPQFSYPPSPYFEKRALTHGKYSFLRTLKEVDRFIADRIEIMKGNLKKDLSQEGLEKACELYKERIEMYSKLAKKFSETNRKKISKEKTTQLLCLFSPLEDENISDDDMRYGDFYPIQIKYVERKLKDVKIALKIINQQ